jgi:hypothetical protein
MALSLKRREAERTGRKEGHAEMGRDLGLCSSKPRNTKDCHPPSEVRREAKNRVPLRGSTWKQVCQHLEFKLLVSITIREYILLFYTTQFGYWLGNKNRSRIILRVR